MRSKKVLTAALLLVFVMSSIAWGGRAKAASQPVDISAALGLDRVQETYSIHPLDPDNDGDTEKILMVYHDQASVVYGYSGGKFIAQATLPTKNLTTGLVEDRHQCVWFDYNKDGVQDIACAAGRGMPTYFVKDADRDNSLFLGNADGSYAEIGTAMGVGDAYGRGRNQITIDANNDGWADLFTLNEVSPDIDTQPTWNVNHLFINTANADGSRSLVDSPSFGLNVQVGHGRCGEAYDWDGDGWQDLIICTKTGPVLYANNHDGTFRDATVEAGLGGNGEVGDMKLVDMNKDGRRDLLMMAWSKAVIRYASGTTFQPAVTVGSFGSGGYTVAAGDFNGDGLQDVYAMRATDTGNDLPDYMYLRISGDGFDSAITIPAATGTHRGSDAESIRIPSYKCDVIVVQNGFEESQGTTAAYVIPGCENGAMIMPSIASFYSDIALPNAGAAFKLKWTTANATGCTLKVDGLAAVNVATTSAGYSQTITKNTPYLLTCMNGLSATSKSITVSVAPTTIKTFSASSSKVKKGTKVTFSWITLSASKCYFYRSTNASAATVVAISGSYTEGVWANTTFTLKCQNDNGSSSLAQKSLVVSVY